MHKLRYLNIAEKINPMAGAGLALVLFGLGACAALNPNFQTPEINVVSVTPGSNTGLEQKFDIGLKVINPNASALELAGMTYTIELAGFKVISGAANDLPSIAAYSDQIVTISASVGLLEGLKLLSSLMSKSQPTLDYRITAKLDTGLPVIGIVPVGDSGTVDLQSFIK